MFTGSRDQDVNIFRGEVILRPHLALPMDQTLSATRERKMNDSGPWIKGNFNVLGR
jgi:hypothetical protein